MSKQALYGVLDPNTREWRDGLFTSILRKIIDNVRGEINKRQWIIFDGDVDPDWVENINSVLDDNRLLTLPNGERLSLPPNVRIMFEVQDLKYATLATVSRCGMVWFSEEVVTSDMIFNHFMTKMKHIPLEDADEDYLTNKETDSPTMKVQRDVATALIPYFSTGELYISNFVSAYSRKNRVQFIFRIGQKVFFRENDSDLYLLFMRLLVSYFQCRERNDIQYCCFHHFSKHFLPFQVLAGLI